MKGSSSPRKLTMKLVARIFRQKGGQVNSYTLYLRNNTGKGSKNRCMYSDAIYYLTDTWLYHYLFLLFANDSVVYISDTGVVCEFMVLSHCC